MKTKEYYIKNLKLNPHPEGGYYSEEYRSSYDIDIKGNKRSLATSIYFLIAENNVSNFHSLKSDELWYFHDGTSLDIAIIDEDGNHYVEKLGLDIENGEKPFIKIPAGSIFGSYNNGGFSLVSCVVSYGFDFEDFKLYKREELLEKYPEHASIIKKLTRS